MNLEDKLLSGFYSQHLEKVKEIKADEIKITIKPQSRSALKLGKGRRIERTVR
jgi:hypothetical protein